MKNGLPNHGSTVTLLYGACRLKRTRPVNTSYLLLDFALFAVAFNREKWYRKRKTSCLLPVLSGFVFDRITNRSKLRSLHKNTYRLRLENKKKAASF
jgi:hypothetical protein